MPVDTLSIQNKSSLLVQKDPPQILDVEVEAAPQPAIFIPICSPALLIEESEVRTFIRELGMKLNVNGRRPSCVVNFSARWTSSDMDVKIMSNPRPQTVHDFFGFAECLYEVEYEAEGSVETAALIAELLTEAGIAWEFDGQRGFDFGCWSPLALLVPDASVPILQVAPTLHID